MIASEREMIKKKIDMVFKQVQQIATICYDAVNESCCEQFINDYNIHKADFIDYSLLQLCIQKSINNILTDDCDFKTINADINIISGNKNFF